MGEIELADSGCLKSASLRELAEESRYIWFLDKLRDFKDFVVKGFTGQVETIIINELHYFCSHSENSSR